MAELMRVSKTWWGFVALVCCLERFFHQRMKVGVGTSVSVDNQAAIVGQCRQMADFEWLKRCEQLEVGESEASRTINTSVKLQ